MILSQSDLKQTWTKSNFILLYAGKYADTRIWELYFLKLTIDSATI